MKTLTDSSAASPEERKAFAMSGMAMLVLNILLMLAAVAGFIYSMQPVNSGGQPLLWPMVASSLYLFLLGPILFFGLRILNPNEALVLTLFGKYYGSIKKPGFYFVNPFVSSVNPVKDKEAAAAKADKTPGIKLNTGFNPGPSKTLSLKAITLNNEKQKVNDALGNPIIIGIVVIWKVVDTAKAVFNVDNYADYLSIQCDSALRNIVRLYPYDSTDEEQEKSLRGSSQELAARLQEEIQAKAVIAGIEILEARITHLSYAPEIAAAMLQRQQATAIIAARQKIVEGAVGMVDMALQQLSANNIVELDEERKAAMVSNLLVVLCASKDAQPIVNSGSIY